MANLDPRYYFVIVVLIIIICLVLLDGSIQMTMFIMALAANSLILTVALIDIFNHGGLHRGKNDKGNEADVALPMFYHPKDVKVRTATVPSGFRSRGGF